MTQYYIGAGGWAYFQVPGLPSLEAYSKAFDFVEVNTTFYRVPSLRQVRSWRRRVPSHFEFTVRCHRAVTHQYNFQVTPETLEVLQKTIRICHVLRAPVLHLQTSPRFPLSSRNIQQLQEFFAVADFDGVRIALELRRLNESYNRTLTSMMQRHNLIHCVDLLNEKAPAYSSDVLYSRLFGRGEENIYQPTDTELANIERQTSTKNYKQVMLSFHSVKMYQDAARLKYYHAKGRFPMVTKSTGIRSLAEVLREDAQFPSDKAELIRHQGWKLVDVTETKRTRAVHVLKTLPVKTYHSIRDVTQTLEAVGKW